MNEPNRVNDEAQQIRAAQTQGFGATIWTYTRLSGPGWLQGAVTLGGGSLAGSLYLGVIMGYNLMWLQPVAMVLGVIMLSAISYVALSTEVSPFVSVNRHISPVLGWGWLIATMMANIVWCMPQFALGTAAVQQNLVPSLDTTLGKYFVAGGILLVAATVVWFYNSGSRGIQIFELILKAMVGVVVLSFFGVVLAMTAKGVLDWGAIAGGLIPDVGQLFAPAPGLQEPIAATGDHAAWWTRYVVNTQKDKIITAFATAVGINMTFLLPFSMLRKGWGRVHRGLAIFDLSIGLIVPYVLATGCVVIASASQFHAHPNDVLAMLESGEGKEVAAYEKLLDARLREELGEVQFEAQKKAGALASLRPALPEPERRLAAMLAERDNLALAKTLAPLVGPQVSQTLFGIGVLGMALSTIIILMLINGFVVCEMLGAPSTGSVHRWGSMIPAVGVLGPFIWGRAAPALAEPTSVFGGAMLPIAYLSFLLLMNSRTVLGDSMPRGAQRWCWNTAMVFATLVATWGSAWGLLGRKMNGFPIGMVGLIALFALLIWGIAGFVRSESR